jgi:lia operon protein LiaG
MTIINRLVTALIILVISSGALKAQEYKVAVENTTSAKLTLTNFIGELPIEGYSGNEIIITSTSGHYEGPSERAKGLKPIYPDGTDNTGGLGLSVEKNGNQVSINCLLPFTRGGSFKIKVPDNLALNIHSGCERNNKIRIDNMKNEIEINNCSDIDLKNVTGPLVVSTISGDVNVTLTGVNKDKPTSIASISGDIDITVPANVAATLEMSTISGAMYSDFDIAPSKGKMPRVGGNAINTPLNGGGGNLKLTVISGNIYLRKAK